MSVIERLRKRRFYPITIDGETVHVRALLSSELKELLTFKDEEESFGFAVGSSLLNEDGSTAFTRSSDESAKEFGARVLTTLDLPTDTRAELSAKIVALSQGPKNAENLAKN